MNKAAMCAALDKIKALESDGSDTRFSKWSREQCRREARRLRSIFGLDGISLA